MGFGCSSIMTNANKTIFFLYWQHGFQLIYVFGFGHVNWVTCNFSQKVNKGFEKKMSMVIILARIIERNKIRKLGTITLILICNLYFVEIKSPSGTRIDFHWTAKMKSNRQHSYRNASNDCKAWPFLYKLIDLLL